LRKVPPVIEPNPSLISVLSLDQHTYMKRYQPQSIHCIFGRRRVGRNIADHNCVAEANKRVLENHGELATPERSMSLSLVKCSDALFKGKEGLVDLGTVDFCLFVLVNVVSSTLVAC
jgi:hypothetical protein